MVSRLSLSRRLGAAADKRRPKGTDEDGGRTEESARGV